MKKKAEVYGRAWDAAKRMAARAKTATGLSEADAASIAADVRVLDEATYYVDFFASIAGGDMSFETILNAVNEALQEKHRREHLGEGALDDDGKPYGPMNPHPWDCSYRLRATYLASCVYECQSDLYQVSYTLNGTDAVCGDDDVEVTLNPEPVPVQEHRERGNDGVLIEATSGVLREAQVDKSSGVIRNVVMINNHSANGGARGRVYSSKALQSVAQMSEGLPSYANHVKDKAEAFKPRDVRDLIGRYRNVRYDAAHDRVLGDLHVLSNHQDWVLPLAEQLGDVVGNSIVSKGLIRSQGDTEHVDDVVAVRSGDLVTDPATTKGLFEHREAWQATHPPITVPNTGGVQKMTPDEIVAHLRANETQQKVVIESLIGDAMRAKDGEIAKLVAKVTELEKTGEAAATALAESKAKISNYEAADALRAKDAKLTTVIEASDLFKKHGKKPEAVTAEFRDVLMEQAEDKWSPLLNDRCKVFDAVSATAARPPSSSAKPSDLSESREDTGDGAVPAGTHAKLMRALKS